MSHLETLQRLFSEGKISRREFIRKAAAMGLAATSASLWLPAAAKAAVPQKGGRLKIGSSGGSTSDSLDPATLPATMPQHVFVCMMNNLVELDANMRPAPILAESLEPSADASVWVFKLRKGVEFHNGKTMTSADVLDTLDYHMNKDSKSPAKSILSSITEVKADGDYAVVFKLAEGNADFPFLLSGYRMGIFPAGTRGADFAKGIGTGPFKLKAYEPGVRFLGERNPNYFKTGMPYFDEVEIIGISDTSARTNALQTGQVHIINQCDVKTYNLLTRAPGIVAVNVAGAMHYTMPMRCDTAPFDNNDVRLALKYAADREQLLKIVLRGYGSVGNDHPNPTFNRYYASELPQRTYDPDKARYHLKKAGMQDETFQLHAADAAFSGAVDTAVLYAGQAEKAGVKVKVVREPNDGYWSNVWMKKSWCMSYWGGRPSEDWFFSLAYAADAKWNETFWKNKTFNQLLKSARAELDEDKRRQMYVEMQRLIRDDGGAVIPLFINFLHAATDKLGHEKVASVYEFDNFRISERWWFK
jgi:peptide/nickel transport system substrate-binding protein